MARSIEGTKSTVLSSGVYNGRPRKGRKSRVDLFFFFLKNTNEINDDDDYALSAVASVWADEIGLPHARLKEARPGVRIRINVSYFS